MNVYIRELVSSLAQSGVHSDVYVRSWRDDLPPVVEVEPGFRVVHIDAGHPDLDKEALPSVVDAFAAGVAEQWSARGTPDLMHAHYWLSGLAGRRLKGEGGPRLVSNFHTLARVKARNGVVEPEVRIEGELAAMACSDLILASSPAEADDLQEHYEVCPDRIEVVPPGVDHAFFSAGDRRGARQALGLGDERVVLFVGRIEPLKGLDVLVAALGELAHTDAVLVVVGGVSGQQGPRELARAQRLVRELDLSQRVRFVPPRPHHLLSTYYRAADVCVVPSRTESFGLVALEAAACGTPVVASAVGGLTTLVVDGETGLLVERREPQALAAAIDTILGDQDLAEAMAHRAAETAAEYRWSVTSARLRRVYADLTTRAPVGC
jgi:D-inositol-3-phosphate glycosyltransferase